MADLSSMAVTERSKSREPQDHQSLISQIENLVVNGQHDRCRELLEGLDRQKMSRSNRSKFAELAWRTNAYLLALKLLKPVVFPKNPLAVVAGIKDLIIYGSSLSSLGATRNAIQILKEVVQKESDPEALFHLASAHIFQWDYGSAIPNLMKFISSEKITPYRRLVGQVNLAAALISQSRHKDAQNLLVGLTKECQKNSHSLLLGNCFELLAQIEISSGRYSQARLYLHQSRELLISQKGVYLLFTEKWLAICDCLESSELKARGLSALARVRRQAIENRHWNTVRDCDLFLAITTQDQIMLRKVIFGTPSNFYRNRARKMFKMKVARRDNFELHLNPLNEDSTGPRIHFDPRQRTSKGQALHSTPTLFNLFQALTDDFYQPQTLGMIFQKVHPSEKFDPVSSPKRVLRALKRLDEWFTSNDLPIHVEFKKSEFQLVSSSPVSILINRERQKSAEKSRYAEIKWKFRSQRFTRDQVCAALGVSMATAERLIASAVKAGLLTKERRPRGVTYRFLSQKRTLKSAS